MDTHDLLAVSQRRHQHVERVLAVFFSDSHYRAKTLGAPYAALWETLERNASGGKRVRPRMVMAAYEALGGTDLDAAAHVGAAFELLHTALIVHDDVIDRDFVRRGGVNVSGRYRDIATTAGIPLPDAEHRGMSVAIIAGDLALFNAYRLIDRSGVDGILRTRLHDLLDEAMFVSAAGELYDVDFALRRASATGSGGGAGGGAGGPAELPTVDEILEMERLKTAVYSFETPLQAGAVLAGASAAAVAALGTFGRNIGIAYQVVDDLLGVFGDERDTGKTTLGDLREGKRTVLLAHAASRPEWAEVEGFIGSPDLTAAQAGRIREVLEKTGSRRFTEALARDFANRAWEALVDPELPDAAREEFRPVVASVLGRVR
ncbi:polyprenyl synthetase family protein [Herbiconiux sp. CPCC 205763]|uniref:Polyprenyl synthetase family protein n=1 Tax=Herbiconiux aconitum TaxID=2970913 RepID=A0ABT2GPZ0_9MICO|nr:polyprenyl synthetase family protein [Herbiconiux aconitum]MCS5717360.1 polyprenyl synthetase family protein [Herbiconiux aconitum]